MRFNVMVQASIRTKRLREVAVRATDTRSTRDKGANMERYNRFVISNNQEECECSVCGWPMYVGDTVVHVQSDKLECEYMSCSVACHTSSLRECEHLDECHNDASWAT